MAIKKTVIFKIAEFPHLSETFILAQLLTAIHLGYETKIIVGKLLDIEDSLHKKTLEDNKILEHVILENYKIPKNKLYRLLQFIVLLLKNCKNLRYIRAYYSRHEKFSLTWLYQWSFYEIFNSNQTVFHVQYGTNKHPLDLLKATGFYKPSLIVSFHGHDAFFPINGFIPNNGYYANLFNFGEMIVANTPYLESEILSLGCPKEKLKVIPVGVDTNFFYTQKVKNTNSDTLKLISVGRLDPVKGHKYSIEVVKELVKYNLDVQLTVVGAGAERHNLEELIAEYQLQQHVFLVGKKSQEEIRSLLNEHDLYLLTAVPLPNGRRETQGLATLEAQACGLPVLAFDSGGVKYTISEGITGFVFKEYDVVGLAASIKKINASRDLLANMSQNTKKFIDDHYSQTHINKIWEETYINLFKQ